MFSELSKYLKKDFFDKHLEFFIYTPEKTYKARVFSAYSTNVFSEKENLNLLNFNAQIDYYKSKSKFKVETGNVEKIVKLSLIENNINSVKFNLSYFFNEHESIKLRFIRKIVELKCGNLDGIGSIHIKDILELLNNNIKGKKYIIGNKFTIEILGKYKAVIY